MSHNSFMIVGYLQPGQYPEPPSKNCKKIRFTMYTVRKEGERRSQRE